MDQNWIDDEFIDFGIPLTEFKAIVNAAEVPEEWEISQPEWDEFITHSYPKQNDCEMNQLHEDLSETSQILNKNPLTKPELLFDPSYQNEDLSETSQIEGKLRGKGYIVKEMWEHHYLLTKEKDEAMRQFLESRDLVDRLHPRDGFYDVRTTPIKPFHEGPAKFVDFTSLNPWTNNYCSYPAGHPFMNRRMMNPFMNPWTNKYCSYPVGHPVIITENFLPPKALFHPVLPTRIANIYPARLQP